jgi:esterase/lipase
MSFGMEELLLLMAPSAPLEVSVLYNHLAARGLAVVRMPNIERPSGIYRDELLADVRAVIEWMYEFRYFMARADANIGLMGFSMGGFAVAAVAGDYPNIKKILLMEPAGNESMTPAPRGS